MGRAPRAPAASCARARTSPVPRPRHGRLRAQHLDHATALLPLASATECATRVSGSIRPLRRSVRAACRPARRDGSASATHCCFGYASCRARTALAAGLRRRAIFIVRRRPATAADAATASASIAAPTVRARTPSHAVARHISAVTDASPASLAALAARVEPRRPATCCASSSDHVPGQPVPHRRLAAIQRLRDLRDRHSGLHERLQLRALQTTSCCVLAPVGRAEARAARSSATSARRRSWTLWGRDSNPQPLG